MAVMTTQDLGARIRELRLRRHLTQAALARAAGVATDSIWRLEQGRYSPSFDTMVKIAAGLEVPVVGLLHDKYDQADELAVVIRSLPETHKQVAYAVLGTLHIQAAVQ
jgi:transcriptional regulator with XRE-family HTH domain